MRYGSLFSGIGGMDLGLDRAGMECVWQVEIDDYCRKVLAKHWPDVPKFEDVREVGAHNLGPVDLICGGFPCQDISYAGKGAGIEGERSGLWSEYHRIICELRPRIVLVENVPALLARGLGRVLGDLAESGYDAEWDCIPAAAVGAPHRRDRVFIVANTSGEQYQGRCPEERWEAAEVVSVANATGQRCGKEGELRYPQSEERSTSGGEKMANPQGLGLEGIGPAREQEQDPRRTEAQPQGLRRYGWWTVEPDVGRVAHGVPARVDRLRGIGNAVVPQVAEYIGRMIMAATQ